MHQVHEVLGRLGQRHVFNTWRAWLIVASTASAAIVLGSIAWAAGQPDGGPLPPVIQRIEDAPTPHPKNFFVSMEGRFFVLPWDDRDLTAAGKRAHPVYNPAWVPFAQCMESRQVEVRPDRSSKFGQDDLDRLLERLNRENPNPTANLAIPAKASGRVSGTLGAFLDCAEQWLTKSPAEIAALTGVVEP